MRASSTDETTTALADLYERDFHAWCLETAELLANGRIDALDIAHLREEIASLAGRDEREVVSRMKRIMQHLLKIEHQPAKRTKSWESTIANQRGELAILFEQSPSLVRLAKRNRTKAYKLARHLASIETGFREDVFPAECPYTYPQIVDPEFLPRR